MREAKLAAKSRDQVSARLGDSLSVFKIDLDR
jgi:hypothetical protein